MALWLNGLVALWSYNKFGYWPAGAHVIRFATGVAKHYAASSYVTYHKLQ